jgi:hypothetical protein
MQNLDVLWQTITIATGLLNVTSSITIVR